MCAEHALPNVPNVGGVVKSATGEFAQCRETCTAAGKFTLYNSKQTELSPDMCRGHEQILLTPWKGLAVGGG